MTEVLAAAVLDSLPGPKYTAALRYAELSFRAPFPKSPTLKRARYSFPEGFTTGLRVPVGAVTSKRGPLRFDADMEEQFAWSLAAADALAARALIVVTPVDATPGPRDRELLAAFVKRLPPVEGRLHVWAPSGLWEQAAAERFAADHGLVLAVDPLEMVVPPGPVAYGRLATIGGRTRISDAMLERVFERFESAGTEVAYVAIESGRSFEQACSLAKISG